MRFKHTFLLALLVMAAPAFAQVANTPEAQARIQQLGQRLDGEMIGEMYAVYSRILKDMPRDGVEVAKNLSYGPDQRNLLDIHHSAGAVGQAVLVFIHGGGFVRGNKSTNGIVHDNITTYFARHGVVGVNATYRLAPGHRWPSGAQDMAAIVSWVRANIAQYGGDPERIFLMGHSAGSAHVASYIFFERFQVNAGNDGVQGAILFSGVYVPRNEGPAAAYYGEDQSKFGDRTTLNEIDGREIPLFLIDSEFDPGFMQMETVDLMAAVCKRDGKCPRRLHLQGHNHISETLHLNSADESVGPALLDFINGAK
jgi:acetyl esterase/lipase